MYMDKAASPIHCILNASAGSGSPHASPQALVDLFAAQGRQATVEVASSGANLAELARRAAGSAAEIIVAGGGDGTVNCVASALVGTSLCLGVLPMGTLNHFAKDLKIPLQLAEAVAVIAHGQPQRVDAGEVNGRIFLNNSSLGLYPRMVRERERLQDGGSRKWPAMVRAARAVLQQYSQLNVDLDAGNKGRLSQRTPFVFIGNNRYQIEGWNIGSRERVDAGRLWLYLAPNVGPLGLFKLGVATVMGRTAPGDDAEIFETSQCTIQTRRKVIDVATDGEVNLMPTPLRYRIRPGALRVMVARAAQPLPAGQ